MRKRFDGSSHPSFAIRDQCAYTITNPGLHTSSGSSILTRPSAGRSCRTSPLKTPTRLRPSGHASQRKVGGPNSSPFNLPLATGRAAFGIPEPSEHLSEASASSAKQFELRRQRATSRLSTCCSTRAGKIGRASIDSKRWFVECCDQRSNSSAPGKRSRPELYESHSERKRTGPMSSKRNFPISCTRRAHRGRVCDIGASLPSPVAT